MTQRTYMYNQRLVCQQTYHLIRKIADTKMYTQRTEEVHKIVMGHCWHQNNICSDCWTKGKSLSDGSSSWLPLVTYSRIWRSMKKKNLCWNTHCADKSVFGDLLGDLFYTALVTPLEDNHLLLIRYINLPYLYCNIPIPPAFQIP